MRSVSRFEANLLRILHCLMRRAPLEQALPLLLAPLEQPRCLGRAAVELVQDALGKGCVLLLARQGAWQRERFLRAERAVEGRLWERTPPEELGLEFSKAALGFLIWLTAVDVRNQPKRWKKTDGMLSPGDRLLLFFAYDVLRPTEVAALLRAQPAFQQNGLCRLAYPDDFADNSGDVASALDPWRRGVGPCLLEALQSRLVERWVSIERSKRGIEDGRRMRELGQAQERVLEAFLAQCEVDGRRDLARFLLETAAGILSARPTAQDWVASLDLHGLRMAERLETYRAALTLLRQLERLRRWDQEARAVSYFDEGYAASQLWKAEWQAHQGEELCDQAQAIIRRLEPL